MPALMNRKKRLIKETKWYGIQSLHRIQNIELLHAVLEECQIILGQS